MNTAQASWEIRDYAFHVAWHTALSVSDAEIWPWQQADSLFQTCCEDLTGMVQTERQYIYCPSLNSSLEAHGLSVVWTWRLYPIIAKNLVGSVYNYTCWFCSRQFLPEHRRYSEAHKIVKCSSSFICIHQIWADFARGLQCLFYRLLRHFRESDATYMHSTKFSLHKCTRSCLCTNISEEQMLGCSFVFACKFIIIHSSVFLEGLQVLVVALHSGVLFRHRGSITYKLGA